ncbi:MAG: FAD/NAD(P)-binding protein [Cytophagales bacterium]|nr:FAD/NAD(P)-binding protein [Rhizobacter sp.]
MTRTIVIVGGGLSGTLTAVHLMRRAVQADLKIVLVNRSGLLARGVAYGTRSADHVLNVPAARMSAFEDDEGHFLRYAQQREAGLQAGSFVRRELYGDYLEWTLQSEQSALSEPQRFEHLCEHVQSMDIDKHATVLQLGHAPPLRADRVVLALGHFAPADPRLDDASALGSPHYVRDPWRADALAHVAPDDPVLLLGSGLTMVDIALALEAHGHRGPMVTLSRRGLLPQPHRTGGAPPIGITLPDELLAGPPHLPHWLRVIRAQCHALAAQGIDWRETLASLRTATPTLWQRLDDRQRAQFLRHLQTHWDVHRHRLAPALNERLQVLLQQGRLRVQAGRLQALQADGSKGLNAIYRPRGGGAPVSLPVAHVINCTGPSTDLKRAREPLMQSLLASGLVTPDTLGLGLAVADDYALQGADGFASPVLRYIGPFLRARYWECTAVPELRRHARVLAETLCAERLDTP